MRKKFNFKTQKPVRQQLRNQITRAEKTLWYHLRGRNLWGYKFRRQQGVGPYIVDFYCPAAKLAVEVDGDSHYQDVTTLTPPQRGGEATPSNLSSERGRN